MYLEFKPLRKEYEERNNIRLITPLGSTHSIWLGKEPIKPMAAFKGLCLRSVAHMAKAIHAVGVVPVALAFAEQYEAM